MALMIGAPTMTHRAEAAVPLQGLGLLRHTKRLALFVMLAGVVLSSAADGFDPTHANDRMAALIIMVVACWALIVLVRRHQRADEALLAAEEAAAEAALREGARLTANAMQDRITNKLSVTVGYCELLVTDPRLPTDLRDQARKAMDGATAAARSMSELRDLTRQQACAEGTRPAAQDFERLVALQQGRSES